MSVKMKFGGKDIPFVYKGDKLIYPNPIKDGLLLWYDFKGMTNQSKDKDIAKDLSGNGNHGQLQNFHYIASEKPQGNGSELYLNTPLIVTDPTLAIYNGVNPPVGGVFNNYNPQTKGMVTNRIDIPATANTLLVMLKLYSKTEDQRYLDRAKLIADYIASTMRTVSFYGSEFQVVPNRNLYADGNWNVLLGEINTRTQYQALWGFSELLYITGEYGDLAYQLMQTVGLFYNNIKGRVTDGELSPFMKGATYDTMIVDTDTNRAGFVWNRFNHSNADVLVKSINTYLKAMGEGEVEDPQGNAFDPQAILDDFAYHIKASHEAGILTMSVTGLPYAFILREEDTEVGVNWDWVGDEGWGDTWFTNDSVLWSLEGIALLHKMNPEYGLGDLITNYRNNFVALQVKTHPTYPNIADSVLFYDRYKFDGSHIEDDPSLSTSGSALLWEVDKILGIVNTSLHEKILKTLFDTQKDTPDDLVMHGAYGWDAADPIALIEMKATGEIYLSPFTEYGASIIEYEYSPDSGYSDNKLVFDGIDDKLQIPQLNLDSTKMSVELNGKTYSYDGDKVVSVDEGGVIRAENLNLFKFSNLIFPSNSTVSSSGVRIEFTNSNYYIANYMNLKANTEYFISIDRIFNPDNPLYKDGATIQINNRTNNSVVRSLGRINSGERISFTLTKEQVDAQGGVFSVAIYISNSTTVSGYLEGVMFTSGGSKAYSPAPEDFLTTELNYSPLSSLQLYNRPLTTSELLHNNKTKISSELKEGQYVQDGLILHYDFSKESNTGEYKDRAFDYSGRQNHGELKNFAFSSGSGYEGEGLRFDGVDDEITIPYANNPFSNNYTWEVVLKPHDVSKDMMFMYGSTTAQYFRIQNGKLGASVRGQDSPVAYTLTNFSMENNKTYHVVMAHSNGKFKIYADGKLVGESDKGLRDERYRLSWIGKYTSVDPRAFVGEMMSAKTYDKALSEEEITHNYEIEKAKFGLE